MNTLAVFVAFLAGVQAKKLGLHEHASKEFKETVHDQIVQSRVNVIETHETTAEDRSSGPHSWHPVTEKHADFLYKHMPLIELESLSKGALYVRGGKDCKKDDTRPHTTQNMYTQGHDNYVRAMYIKDDQGKVVHMVEYDHIHEGAHPVDDFSVNITETATTLQPYALISNAGLWQGPKYAVADLVKPFLKEEL